MRTCQSVLFSVSRWKMYRYILPTVDFALLVNAHQRKNDYYLFNLNVFHYQRL